MCPRYIICKLFSLSGNFVISKVFIVLISIAFPELAKLTTPVGHSPEEEEVHPEKMKDLPSIKLLYSNLMRSSPDEVESAIKSLVDRFTSTPCDILESIYGSSLSVPGVEEDIKSLANLFLLLSRQYPGDVGCLSVFFFNYVKLKPGEAIFLKVGTLG